MARVSVQDAPTVAPSSSPGNDYSSVQASPTAFGSLEAQADQRLGGDLSQASNTATQAIDLVQQRHNQVATSDAFNQFMVGSRNITTGDPNDPNDRGFYGLEGRGALDAYGGAVDKVDKLRQQIVSGLQNDAQRQEFDQASRRLQQITTGEMGRFREQQFKSWGATVAKEQEANNLQDIGVGWNSEERFQNSLHDARAGRVQYLQSTYGDNVDPAVVRGELAKVSGDAVKARVLPWAESDPLAARNWLMNGTVPDGPGPNAKQVPVNQAIDGATFDALTQHLLPKAKTAQAQGIVQEEISHGAVGPLPTGPLPGKITAAADQQGVDRGTALTISNIENGLGRLPDRPGSQYQGPFQMGDDAWAARGGTVANRRDPDAQVSLGVANVKHSQDVAAQALGAVPAGWQTYVVHQQGDLGGAALLKADPAASAVSTLATAAYSGNIDQATRAVTANGGNAGSTVGQFLGHWQQTFQAKAVDGGSGAASVASGPPARPDPDAILQRIMDRTAGDPDLQARAISFAQGTLHRMAAVQNQARADMNRQIGGSVAALNDGQDVQPPSEATVRSLFPPDLLCNPLLRKARPP